MCVAEEAKLGAQHVRHVRQPVAETKHEHAAQLSAILRESPMDTTRSAVAVAAAAAARPAAADVGVGRASRERDDAHLSHGRRELVESEVDVPLPATGGRAGRRRAQV